MAIYISDKDGNKKKVAGNGIPGKSAYQYAQEGGYTGTEEEYQTLLANAATTQYVDGLVGDIAALLGSINGEEV